MITAEVPLKWVASYNDEALPESTPDDRLISYIEISDVNEVDGVTDVTDMTFGDAPSRARRLVRAGDVVVSTVRTYLRAVAEIRDEFDGAVASTGFAVLRARSVNERFLKYAVLDRVFMDQVVARSTGVSYPAINASDLVRIKIPMPSMKEQRAIADYLDRETAQIDAFIAKNEELIALLTERRAAAIAQGVTRGADPQDNLQGNAPSWMGGIHRSWAVQAIKTNYSIVVGKMLNESKAVGEYVPYMRAANIQPCGLDISEVKEMKASRKERAELSLREGDVVFVEGGGGYGRSDYLRSDLNGWVFQNHVIRLRPRGEQDGRFLNYWLQHVKNVGHYEALSAFATIPNVSGHKLGRIEMPAPSLAEQKSAVAYIERATKKIDRAQDVARKVIELARERRVALISAAVSGEIDVEVNV